MNRAFRTYDALTILGLLVVAAWAPGYLAQGSATRDVASGTEFVTPVPRYGDTITFGFILQHRDEAPRSTGPVLTLSFQRPSEDEREDGAVANITRTYHARHVDLGVATFLQDSRTVSALYDPRGKGLVNADVQMYDSGRHLATFLQPRPDQVIEGEMRGGRIEVSDLPTQPIDMVYRPTTDLVEMVAQGLPIIRRASPEQDEDVAPTTLVIEYPSPEFLRVAPLAAEHDGRILFARHVQEFGTIYGPVKEPFPEGLVGFRHNLDNFEFRWKDMDDLPGSIRRGWQWYAADLPITAGAHNTFLDHGRNRTTSIDLVPLTYEAGSEPIPIDPEWEYVAQTGAPADAIAASELSRDLGAIWGETHMKALHDRLLAEGNSEPSRRMLQDGGFILGFAWQLSRDGGETWVATIVAPNGTTTNTVVEIVAGSPVGWETLCGRTIEFAGSQLRGSCVIAHPGLLERIPQVLPPSAAFDLLRSTLLTKDTGEESAGLYMPELLHPLDFAEGGGQIMLEGHPLTPLFHPFLTRTPTGDAHLHGVSQATLAVRNGGLFEHRQIDLESGETRGAANFRAVPPDERMGRVLQPQTAEVAEAVRTIDPVGPQAAYGGLALVLLGLLFRLVAALKAGAHLPLLAPLYAKITRDKALLHEHRETIHALVRADPGVTIGEVVERSGLSRTGAFHHLATLAKNGLVAVTTLGRTRHYFPGEMKDPRLRTRIAVRRNPDWDAVLAAVEAHPGAALHELLPHVPQRKSALSRVGTRLERLGLVRKEPDGRTVRFFPTSSSADPEPSARASS